MTKTELDAAVAERLAQIEGALGPLGDEVAAELAALFPVWAVGADYSVGCRARYQDELYRCEQAHTSQAGWEPPGVPALWIKIARPGVIPVWRQPTGAQDAYNTGDKVHYPSKDDPVYVSEADGNVWEPTVYGWRLTED